MRVATSLTVWASFGMLPGNIPCLLIPSPSFPTGDARFFVRAANAELLMQTLFRYRETGRFALHGFAIMQEHVHVLLTPLGDNTIERCVQLIKGGYSYTIRKQFPGEVWNSGYHDHRVRDREDFENQLRYIADNPTRRGLKEHEFVHTRFPCVMDSIPGYLVDS